MWIEGQQIALTTPTLETRNAEVPPIPQMGPPPEVIFSDPAEGEIDVPLKAPIRLQFSREMNPDTFKGNVALDIHHRRCRQCRRRHASRSGAAFRSSNTTARSDRSRFGSRWTTRRRYRNVILELRDGIAATDGAKLKPWQLTFVFGAQ